MAIPKQELQQRLTLPDYSETAEDVQKAVVTQDSTGVSGTPPEDLRNEDHYTFKLNWKSGTGKVWTGEFTNRVLTIKDRRLMGIMRSRLAGGLSLDSLDALTAEINLILAHLSFSLERRPKWAEKLEDLHDPELLRAIYKEVSAHEEIFLGWRSAEEGSEATA